MTIPTNKFRSRFSLQELCNILTNTKVYLTEIPFRRTYPFHYYNDNWVCNFCMKLYKRYSFTKKDFNEITKNDVIDIKELPNEIKEEVYPHFYCGCNSYFYLCKKFKNEH